MMKKQFILLTIVVAAAVSLLLVCCHDADSPPLSSQTDLKNLLESDEFYEYSDEIRRFSLELSQAFRSLTPEKRQKIDEIQAVIDTTTDKENLLALAKEYFAILNVDNEQHYKKLDELSQKLFKDRTFTQDEMEEIINQHFLLQKSALSTKAKTSSAFEACCTGCQSAREIADEFCTLSHKHTPEKLILCRMQRAKAHDFCVNKCAEQYFIPTPPTINTTPAVTPEPDSTKPTATNR